MGGKNFSSMFYCDTKLWVLWDEKSEVQIYTKVSLNESSLKKSQIIQKSDKMSTKRKHNLKLPSYSTPL